MVKLSKRGIAWGKAFDLHCAGSDVWSWKKPMVLHWMLVRKDSLLELFLQGLGNSEGILDICNTFTEFGIWLLYGQSDIKYTLSMCHWRLLLRNHCTRLKLECSAWWDFNGTVSPFITGKSAPSTCQTLLISCAPPAHQHLCWSIRIWNVQLGTQGAIWYA